MVGHSGTDDITAVFFSEFSPDFVLFVPSHEREGETTRERQECRNTSNGNKSKNREGVDRVSALVVARFDEQQKLQQLPSKKDGWPATRCLGEQTAQAVRNAANSSVNKIL